MSKQKAVPTAEAASVTQQSSSPRTRSPNYPAVSLDVAIQRIKTLFPTSKRYGVGQETIAKAWGNSLKSSTFKLVFAAVRSYGFLANTDASSMEWKLTPLALDIVADYPEGSDR